MASNKGLREAKAGKNDEFYTQLIRHIKYQN